MTLLVIFLVCVEWCFWLREVPSVFSRGTLVIQGGISFINIFEYFVLRPQKSSADYYIEFSRNSGNKWYIYYILSHLYELVLAKTTIVLIFFPN